MKEYTYLGIAIKEYGFIKYICFQHIPEKYRDEFHKWMNFDTGLYNMIGCENYHAVYLHDFEAWCKQKGFEK